MTSPTSPGPAQQDTTTGEARQTGERLASPADPHEGLKADAGVEAKAAERDQTPSVGRAGSSGAADTGPAPADEQPSQAKHGGTAAGDPLSGVGLSAEDAAEAVSGDTGPEHPGQRS